MTEQQLIICIEKYNSIKACIRDLLKKRPELAIPANKHALWRNVSIIMGYIVDSETVNRTRRRLTAKAKIKECNNNDI